MNFELIKFLLVDDVEENLTALEALLRRDGLEILTARSGAEALELLLVNEVALAFLDVQMPDMNGFELAELMRGAERTKNVPIIFVTAGARDPQRVFKGYGTGAVDFLFKPIDPQVLRGKADVFFELFRQRQELANSLRLNEMFVAILGHDLRNPLSTIMNGATLVERQVADEKLQRTVRRMVSAGQRMTDMIDQLLDLTRARLGGGMGFVRVRKRLDVAALLRRTVEELADSHPDKHVDIVVEGDCTTTGDPDRLLQLFSNLIGNAINHGAAGTPIRVTVECAERDILVRVANGGVIPADVVPILFDPFRGRAKTSTSGLGLGLFISQQIAIAHGGAITVESTEAAGTVFTVGIPRRVLAERPTPSGRSRRVLIVDDDENVRDALREAFEEHGHQAATAADGREAIDLLGAAPPFDAVVLDLVLPLVDGSEVYRHMLADASLSSIPVVVSTANPSRAPRGTVVIPKPVDVDRVLDAVAELWRGQ